MANIRPCTAEDLFAMQTCNLSNLPENYHMMYYYFHFLSWPQLLHVAEDDDGKIGGYVLAKMEDEVGQFCHGHITSLAVGRCHRKQGIAQLLMQSTHQAMQDAFQAEFSSLHVRVSNRAASSLYASLGYKKHEVEEKYYADKEDALGMRKMFSLGLEREAIRLEQKNRKKEQNLEVIEKVLPSGGSSSADLQEIESKGSNDTVEGSGTEDSVRQKKTKKKPIK